MVINFNMLAIWKHKKKLLSGDMNWATRKMRRILEKQLVTLVAVLYLSMVFTQGKLESD